MAVAVFLRNSAKSCIANSTCENSSCHAPACQTNMRGQHERARQASQASHHWHQDREQLDSLRHPELQRPSDVRVGELQQELLHRRSELLDDVQQVGQGALLACVTLYNSRARDQYRIAVMSSR